MRKRAATPALFAVVLAFGALAEVQPSQRLLDHEARTRASFMPADRARVQALEARLSTKMSLHDVTTLAHGETAGGLASGQGATGRTAGPAAATLSPAPSSALRGVSAPTKTPTKTPAGAK